MWCRRYVYCRQCDLASLESVRGFAKELREREGRVDALINNAGVMHHPRSVSGPFRLTKDVGRIGYVAFFFFFPPMQAIF